MKILFVCHGNICRSPMAEIVTKELLRQRGLTEKFVIASAAVSAEELGNPIYPPARAELRRQGLPVPARQAWQLCRADYEKYDLFVCMDGSNLRAMHRIFGGDPAQKMRLLLDRDVEDPWYTGRYDVVLNEIRAGCAALLDELTRASE